MEQDPVGELGDIGTEPPALAQRHGVNRELIHRINGAAEAVDALVAVTNDDRRQIGFCRDRDQHRVEVLRLVEQQIIEITLDPVPEFERLQIGVMGDRQVVLFKSQQLFGDRERHSANRAALRDVIQVAVRRFEFAAGVDHEVVEGAQDRGPHLAIRHSRDAANHRVIGTQVFEMELLDQATALVDLQRPIGDGMSGAGIDPAREFAPGFIGNRLVEGDIEAIGRPAPAVFGQRRCLAAAGAGCDLDRRCWRQCQYGFLLGRRVQNGSIRWNDG
jgi:hypothetical protein